MADGLRRRRSMRNLGKNPIPISEVVASDGSQNVEKKTRRSYSFVEKSKILKALENRPLKSVSQEYKVNKKLLIKWRKRREEILDAACDKNMRDNRKKRKSTQDVDRAVHEWFVNAQAAGIPINGSLVRQKALELNEEMGGNPDFQASSGWYSRWKSRQMASSPPKEKQLRKVTAPLKVAKRLATA